MVSSKVVQQNVLFRRIQRLHFVGIGGVGMGGIAEVMINLGYQVSGSDLSDNAMVARLRDMGAKIYSEHAGGNVEQVDVLVVSTAIDAQNPEIREANARRIPVVKRAEMLAELMRFRHGIAVAGTHGKTTTTSLVASILTEGQLDPTYVIGGKLTSSAKNAHLGESEWMVAEADESDASFLHLQPMISIVTNIDADHLSTYGGNFNRLKEVFVEFLHHLPFYGLAVLCADDPVVAEIIPEVARPYKTYAIDAAADVRATNLRQNGFATCFDIQLAGGDLIEQVELNLPGRHNVLNALAAATVALELGLAPNEIKRALKKFAGIGRRMQRLGEVSVGDACVELVDDYAHHPREIAATLQAARAGWPEQRLLAVFQPHRYSRTSELFEDFVEVLSTADVLLLTEVYPAGEEEILGANSRSLARAIRNRGRVDPVFVADLKSLPDVLADVLQDNDLILTMGAGNIGAAASTLGAELKGRENA